MKRLLLEAFLLILLFQSAAFQLQKVSYANSGCLFDQSYDGSICSYGTSTVNMTIELCSKFCTIKPWFNYFANSYGSQCCCYNQSRPSLISVNQSFCDQPCMGNTQESCGGTYWYLFNIYSSKNDVTLGQQIVCAYVKNEVFTQLQFFSSQNYYNLSISLCVQQCNSIGINYAFLYYYCYCSNLNNLTSYVTIDITSTNATSCGAPCIGNPSQYCGGYGAPVYNVYQITNVVYNSTEYYAVYQGSYAYNYSVGIYPFYLGIWSYYGYSYSLIDALRVGSFFNFQLGSFNMYQLTSFNDFTNLYKIADPYLVRSQNDMSFMSWGYMEVYQLNVLDTKLTQSINNNSASLTDLGCYQNSVAEVLWQTSNLTTQRCVQFCINLNYKYAATRIPHCYCGQNVTGLVLIAANCSYSCDDNENNCGGPYAQNLYQITVTTTTTTTTSTLTTATTTSTTPTTIASSTTSQPNISFSSSQGSLFRKISCSDMFFLTNNIIQTTFEPNVLRCGAICAVSTLCSSFVFKTNQNCTLFVSTPNNSAPFIQSSISTLYLKIA